MMEGHYYHTRSRCRSLRDGDIIETDYFNVMEPCTRILPRQPEEIPRSVPDSAPLPPKKSIWHMIGLLENEVMCKFS